MNRNDSLLLWASDYTQPVSLRERGTQWLHARKNQSLKAQDYRQSATQTGPQGERAASWTACVPRSCGQRMHECFLYSQGGSRGRECRSKPVSRRLSRDRDPEEQLPAKTVYQESQLWSRRLSLPIDCFIFHGWPCTFVSLRQWGCTLLENRPESWEDYLSQIRIWWWW